MFGSNQNIYTQLYELYQQDNFKLREQEYDWYRQQSSSLREAIYNAFLSKFPNKNDEIKIHPHQRRPASLFPGVFQQAAQKALENFDVKNLSDNDFDCFDKIYQFVDSIRKIREISGFGELAHYDVSMRIAKYQDTQYPNCGHLTEVYLHRGTFDGAKAVFNAGHINKNIKESDIREGKKISVSHFPSPLNALSGDHLENLLCIYKEELKKQKISNHKQKYCTKSQTRKNRPCT